MPATDSRRHANRSRSRSRSPRKRSRQNSPGRNIRDSFPDRRRNEKRGSPPPENSRRNVRQSPSHIPHNIKPRRDESRREPEATLNRARSQDRNRNNSSQGSGRPAEIKREARNADFDRDRERNERNPIGHVDQSAQFGRKDQKNATDFPPGQEKVKANFGLSGKLLEDTNMVNGVVVTYSQPPEARIPKVRWRLYPFKGEETLPTMFIHRQSAYLLGRDRKIVDIPIDHPSCSKQHAVIQYRMLPTEREDGTVVRRVKPYIIDLASANGTFVNKKKIETQRFVELLEKDVITFGFSSREYVMLHEGSKDDEYLSGAESGGESD